jgi:DNA (cytosine-5)-methyltransferase 1
LRILPWAVYKHAKKLLPDVIIMENVEEIQQWGPLDETGHPIKERAGEDYRKFINSMKNIGYDFDSKELVAADYGAPTTRKRWYAIFRRDKKEIVFPKQTHSKDGATPETESWLECGDYIDWSDLGTSIFARKKPLAEATMKRIANGYVKYVVNNPKPYIVNNEEAVAFLIQYHGEQKSGDARGQLLTEPIKTIDTSNRYGLVTAFVTKFYKSGIGQGCQEPLHTITTSPGHFGIISAFLIKYYGSGGSCQTTDRPLDTITTKDRFGLVNAVTDIDGDKYILKDIFLRMLKPEELKLMQGFPNDYIIDRDINFNPYPIKEQVARIGNSVVPVMAQRLVEANCPYLKIGERSPSPTIYQQNSGQIAFR